MNSLVSHHQRGFLLQQMGTNTDPQPGIAQRVRGYLHEIQELRGQGTP